MRELMGMNTIEVLIADHELIHAMGLKVRFEQLGCRKVRLIHTSEEALAYAHQHKPSLIIINPSLRGNLDGIETARLIHQIRPVPFIFLSTTCQEFKERRLQLNEIHLYTFLFKPTTIQELRTNVEMLLPECLISKQVNSTAP
jgi:two-component SAPR family response regulator